ncbi:hypothetical protein [Streptomyces sp. NPDC019224]|uniref:hypothetical protein n=1 Tax=Streptomyces sp. NPDC019224 TaxID=3154484 RepID=UPI0033D3DC5C
MTQQDQYRLSSPTAHGPGRRAHDPGGANSVDAVRTLLWAAIVLSAVVNMLASYSAADTWVLLVCGGVSVLAAAILVVRAVRGRR